MDWIRTSDAVVVVGAGASFMAGMPLADQLSPLVWQTLDAHAEVKKRTCDALGVAPGHAKDVIGSEPSRIQAGFSQIAADKGARRTFQSTFARLDRDRTSARSPVHTALARMVHGGRVLHVISLNWDTLLEVAFRTLYGIDINAQGTKLWKPHGDCSRPEDDWTLPHERGSIPDLLVDRMTAVARDRPRTLLIVGYSERDDLIVDRLIRPLADRWRIFRIGPSAAGEGAITCAAQEALDYLVEGLCPCPEFPGWEYVSFENQRGIEAAVSGERLGPRDVDTCPRLPHFGSAKRGLELLHSVEIAGEPGCGKSITAWQLAREYHRRGWEVLRPDPTQLHAAISPQEVMYPTLWKKVLVIDDTQIFPDGFAEHLGELAGPDTKLIRATTDPRGDRSGSVRIPAKVSVATLAAEFRRRRDEILPVVSRYDPRVGDRYFDLSFESRIDVAENENSPWQFAFVLRGGWWQFREELNALRDFDRADLLLLAVAARQLLTLDAGCTIEEIVRDARLLGRHEAWVASGIERLRRRGAILPGDRLRCPHVASAEIVIRSFFADRKDTEFMAVVSLLRDLVVEQEPALRGISYFLKILLYSDKFIRSHGTERAFFLPELAENLLKRCCSVTTPVGRRDSAYLLREMIWHRVIEPQTLISYLDVLKHWLETVDGTSAYAIGDMVFTLRGADKALAQRLVESVEPVMIAGRLAVSQCAEGYAWGGFLKRLRGVAGDRWRDGFQAALPRNHMLVLAASFRTTEVEELSELLVGLAGYDFNFATECLRRAMPTVEQRFRESSLEAHQEIQNCLWSLLGHDLFGRTKPNRAQKKLSKQMAGAICPARFVAGLLSCRYGEWEPYARMLSWVQEVNPTKHHEIVNVVDWKELSVRTRGLWQTMPRELRLLLSCLAVDEDGRPVREWIAEHAGLMSEIDPIIAGISPEAAVAVVRRGGHFNLGGHNQSDWKLQAWALTRVAVIAKDVALSAIEMDLARVAGHLAKLEAIDCQELPAFLRAIEDLAPDFLVRLFRSIDLGVVSDNWPKRLQDADKEVRRSAREVILIAGDRGEGALKGLAQRISATPKKKTPSRKQRGAGG